MKKSWFVVAAALPLLLVGTVGAWQLMDSSQRRLGALGFGSGEAAMYWRGAWSADAKYQAGEVVGHKGNAYVAEVANSGAEPSPKACAETCNWVPLAIGVMGPKGDPGAPGAQGAAGPQGPPGPSSVANVQCGTGLTGNYGGPYKTTRKFVSGFGADGRPECNFPTP